jgi:drug/metabolite transporter (DMT)-like permease
VTPPSVQESRRSMPILNPPAPLDERAVRKGILIMLCGLLLFAVLNAMVKELAAAFPVNQIVFFRGFFGLIPLVGLLAAMRIIPRPEPGRVAANLPHVLAMTGTLLLAYVAMGALPLAETTAIFFLTPVLVAVLSAVVLREAIPLRLWAAVSIGFVGVLVIARPSGLSVEMGVAYGLAAAVLGSVSMLQQRHLALRLDPLEVVFWFMALSSLAMLPTLFVWWAWPTPAQWTTLAVMGVVSGVGQFLLILPLKFAPASRLAPMHYTNLLGGIVVGYLWFGEVPDTVMVVGCLIVAGSTALVLAGGPGAPPEAEAEIPALAVCDVPPALVVTSAPEARQP